MQRAIIYSFMVAVSLGWWLTGAAVGQVPQGSDKAQQFMQQAASDGNSEVELGKMAVNQASNPEVQRFAQRMVTDHTKANQQLAALAQAKQVTLPQSLSPQQQKTAEALAKLRGTNFDRQYVQHMVTDHEKALQLFMAVQQESQDPNLQAFAIKTLPTLQEHLRMARQLAQQLTPQKGNRSQAR